MHNQPNQRNKGLGLFLIITGIATELAVIYLLVVAVRRGERLVTQLFPLVVGLMLITTGASLAKKDGSTP